jgi:hypothetical protein
MSHRISFLSRLPLAVLIGTTVLGHYATAAEPSSAVVAKLDKDNDKTLDWAEVQAGASARFDKLNKDNDGTLDAKELSSKAGHSQKLLID